MSSFLHSAKHFNSIEKTIIELKIKNSDSGFCYGISIHEIEYTIDQYRKFSAICVINQYSKHYDNPELEIATSIELLKDRRESLVLKPIDLYKAMLSMEYQIEFNHMNRDFTDTEKIAIETYGKIKDSLTYLIISSLSEYDKSNTWSI